MIPINIQAGSMMKIRGGNRDFIHITNPPTNLSTLFVTYDGSIQTFNNQPTAMQLPPGSSIRLDNCGAKLIFCKDIYLSSNSSDGENYNVQGVDQSEVSFA